MAHDGLELPELEWIVRGDADALVSNSTGERSQLNTAWAALAEGDLDYADRVLPSTFSDLRAGDWSLVAEGELIRAHLAYARGDLDSARTMAGLAQAGLVGQVRRSLLHPALLIQASAAMHHRDLEGVLAIRQQVSADCGCTWAAAINAIADFAQGEYDRALEHAARSIAISISDSVGVHLVPHIVDVVAASIHRDRGDEVAALDALDRVTRSLEHYLLSPILLEVRALRAHLALDAIAGSRDEVVAAVLELALHRQSVPVFQDLVDIREAQLRIRMHDLTRARVLLDRMDDSSMLSFLEAYIDAEHSPSRSLTKTSRGTHRWHGQNVEVEMIRARARMREPETAAIHVWRALDIAASSGSIRPLLDNPMAARIFSRPDLVDLLDRTESFASPRAREHLQHVLTVHQRHELVGPKSHDLTARELEVLRAVVDAGSFASVAKVMVLSRWTVRGHFYSACRKLGVSGQQAAAIRLRQIEQPRA